MPLVGTIKRKDLIKYLIRLGFFWTLFWWKTPVDILLFSCLSAFDMPTLSTNLIDL
jgi:hypothetical protein